MLLVSVDLNQSSAQRHHFYPAFCLRRWRGADGRLQFFEQLAGNAKIVSGRASPERICREADLYSFQHVKPELKHVLEREFITAEIDTPAADVLRLIEDGGLRALSLVDRRSWAKFMLSLPARSPEAINGFGPEIARRLIDKDPTAYRAARRPDDPESLSAWADKHRPGLWADCVRRMLPRLLENDTHLMRFAMMEWWTRELPDHQLLTSDSPLLAFPRGDFPNCFNMNASKCALALPLGPHRVFFASNDPSSRQKLRKMAPGRIALMMNDEIIWRRRKYVYAADESLSSWTRADSAHIETYPA